MNKNNMKLPILKEIETDLFRTLQKTYSEALSQLLTELDQLSKDELIAARYDKLMKFGTFNQK